VQPFMMISPRKTNVQSAKNKMISTMMLNTLIFKNLQINLNVFIIISLVVRLIKSQEI